MSDHSVYYQTGKSGVTIHHEHLGHLRKRKSHVKIADWKTAYLYSFCIITGVSERSYAKVFFSVHMHYKSTQGVENKEINLKPERRGLMQLQK